MGWCYAAADQVIINQAGSETAMGQWTSRDRNQPISLDSLQYDQDDKWQNLYRQRGRNQIYKWVGVNHGGELIDVFEGAAEKEKPKDWQGEEALRRFAQEHIEPMLYNGGQDTHTVSADEFAMCKPSAITHMTGKDDVAQERSTVMGSSGVDASTAHFEPHSAQWKLNDRGIEGETVIHLLLSRDEPVCTNIARELLKAYPGLANDRYLGDDMFGQTPLHQAIVNDDFDLVRLLVDMGADVSARATGRFFRPEDQKTKTKPKATNYIGYAYYGEYPLAFAACFGNKDIYDMLLHKGAAPNAQDSYGNTVLHMCVIHYSRDMYTYAVRHWSKPADVNVLNNNGYTPLTLAAKLGRKDIFEEMLELTKSEFWRFSDMTCSAYPLMALDTIRPDGTTNWDSALMTIINGNTAGHLDMVGTEVIQRLLRDKWKAFGIRKMAVRGLFTIGHLLAMCLAVYTRPEALTFANEQYRNGSISHGSLIQPQSITDWVGWAVRIGAESFVCINCVFFVVQQQGAEIRMQGFRGYFQSLLQSTAPDKAIFLLANICILMCVPLRLGQWHLEPDDTLMSAAASSGSQVLVTLINTTTAATTLSESGSGSVSPEDVFMYQLLRDAEELLLCIAVPGSWFFLLFFARAMFLTGPFVQMIYSMIAGDILRFGIIALIIITSFSQAFYFMGKDMSTPGSQFYRENTYTYGSFIETFVTLFRMSMGGYDYEEFFSVHYEYPTKVMFVLYMISMPIMMINMLIAMMGNTYTTVISQAEKAWRQQWARIIMVLERSVDRRQLEQAQIDYSYKLQDDMRKTNANSNKADELRGLVVIKQTNKTRAQQRKHAVDNWKKISRQVIRVYSDKGVDQARRLLHTHRQFSIDIHEVQSGLQQNTNRPTTSMGYVNQPPMTAAPQGSQWNNGGSDVLNNRLQLQHHLVSTNEPATGYAQLASATTITELQCTLPSQVAEVSMVEHGTLLTAPPYPFTTTDRLDAMPMPAPSGMQMSATPPLHRTSTRLPPSLLRPNKVGSEQSKAKQSVSAMERRPSIGRGAVVPTPNVPQPLATLNMLRRRSPAHRHHRDEDRRPIAFESDSSNSQSTGN